MPLRGEGLLLHANGEFYAGGFKAGLAEGVGRYEDLSGGIYAGQFSGGKPNGIGPVRTLEPIAAKDRSEPKVTIAASCPNDCYCFSQAFLVRSIDKLINPIGFAFPGGGTHYESYRQEHI